VSEMLDQRAADKAGVVLGAPDEGKRTSKQPTTYSTGAGRGDGMVGLRAARRVGARSRRAMFAVRVRSLVRPDRAAGVAHLIEFKHQLGFITDGEPCRECGEDACGGRHCGTESRTERAVLDAIGEQLGDLSWQPVEPPELPR
jgi:hypothetical protein